MERPVYQMIATSIDAAKRCKADVTNKPAESAHWFTVMETHLDRIDSAVKEHFPSGSGFDCGTKFESEESTGEKLVFSTSFHHMNDVGMYDGWTEHKIIVTPSLMFGFSLRITGRNRNDIKDYIHEVFDQSLTIKTTY